MRAHDFTITATQLQIHASGDFRVEMICDLDALLLGWAPGHDPEKLVEAVRGLSPDERRYRQERLRAMFERRVRVRVNGDRVPFEVSFPDAAEAPETLIDPPSVLGVTARLHGRLPDSADAVTFWASRAFSAVRMEVFYTGSGPAVPGGDQVLGVGEESDPVPLAPTPEQLRAARSAWTVLTDYVGLGFLHILPRGLDHVLFVLGLVLLRLRARELLLQVTTFTLAHTLTLALSTLGWVRLPGEVVEPLIALSIAYVALENLWHEEVGRIRLVVVCVFGLIHGLGFAGVLGDLGMPAEQLVPALVGFNLGVEAGQLTVVAVAAVCLVVFARKDWYHRRIVVPLSLAIAAAGLFMAAQRVFF